MSKNTITLDNFADFHGEVNGVEIRSNLPFEPYVPSTEINVNLGRITRAARIGHLGSITFRRYTEQSSITPGINSVGEDGSATASFTAAATKTSRVNADAKFEKKVAPWTVKGRSTIKLNLGHDDLDGADLREPQLWSTYLDTSVREGLRMSSGKNLLHRPLTRSIVTAGWTGVPLALLASGQIGTGAEMYVTNEILFAAAISVVSLLASKNRQQTGEYTLIPALPLDRLGLVQAYTRTRKFVATK